MFEMEVAVFRFLSLCVLVIVPLAYIVMRYETADIEAEQRTFSPTELPSDTAVNNAVGHYKIVSCAQSLNCHTIASVVNFENSFEIHSKVRRWVSYDSDKVSLNCVKPFDVDVRRNSQMWKVQTYYGRTR